MDKGVFFQGHSQLMESSLYTGEKLEELRRQLENCLKDSDFKNDITIIATGSYGRGEASTESDLDLFIIFDADQPIEDTIPEELEGIKKVVENTVPKSAGDTGTFGAEVVISFSEMLKNIGGQYDTNQSLTRRMLFLLEGTWLFGGERFLSYRRRLLEKYIKSSSPDFKVPKFFLNDIIRYYRTIATDFEFKTSEDDKKWGLRNIKLRFSRKLLYFGGIIVAAEISERSTEEKLEQATELLTLPVLERIGKLSDGSAEASPIFTIYQAFVAKVSDESTRMALEGVTKASRAESQHFMELRKLGDEFSDALFVWIENKYSTDHPIHHSLIF